MRLRKALVTVSLILVAKAVLIGWVACGRAEMIATPSQIEAGATLMTATTSATAAADPGPRHHTLLRSVRMVLTW
ncbi:hypothetical protein H7I41_03845 [Mycobacterium manitobense]|uniref:Uncharacterized protein n=1 Tax=[Mycobacterium] manitobense TaxID=190147 RepID=A0A9X2YKX5_9MYCO|nr:hypothetical protein [[Mycobacterium] manitobense]MCV7169056.1 hypothetical protein [[Mycobacterium] manitobense]